MYKRAVKMVTSKKYTGDKDQQIMKQMNNTYTIRDRSLVSILSKADSFQEKMDKFRTRHSEYGYKIDLSKDEIEDIWKMDINIQNNGKENIKAS